MTSALFAEHDKAAITSRLRRIEGQVRGLQRMIEEDRDRADIVQQLSAARAALDRAGNVIVASGLRGCLAGAGLDHDTRSRIDTTLGALASLRS